MKRTSFLRLASVAVIFIFAAALSIQSQTVNMGRTYVSSQNVRYPNEAGTGTTVNKLAKLTGAPSTAIIAAVTDTEGIIGIVVAGAGAAGSADIAFSGKALCDFDSATTAGHYVTIDTSTAGDCMDTGAATYPTSGQVIGVVTSTNGGAGTYEVDMTLRQARASGGGAPSGLVQAVLFTVMTSPDGTLDEETPVGGYVTPIIVTDTGTPIGLFRDMKIVYGS